MKIAVAGTRGFPGVQGGVENHCENLYIHLTRLGCSITVFTRKPYVNIDLKTYNGINLIPIDCYRNKFLEAFIHTFNSVRMARKLNPDLIHIHAIGPSLFAPIARLLGMKVVVTHHGPDYERKKWNPAAKAFLKFCEWMGMIFANEVITIAGNIAVDVKRKFKRDAVVIPNGVNIPELRISDGILKKHGLQEKKYILSVGRFVPEKGFDCLIDAFNSGDFKDWKLVIAGSADHEDTYSMGLQRKASLNSNIILTGFITGMPLQELYSHAGLFVLPSYYEGLPIVLLEAMSYGLSCIASDIPANRNVELDAERYFQAGDIQMLFLKIKEFIGKQWSNEDIKRQLNIIDEDYNWDKIARRTKEIYQRIIQQTNS